MNIFQVLIVALIAGIQGYDGYGTQIWTMNYMIYSMIVGLIMGDPMTGLTVGASVQLMSLGVAALGGASMPNYGMAAIVATALTISTGQEASVGLAVGIAAGALGVELDVIAKVLNGFVCRWAEKLCMEKKFDAMLRVIPLAPFNFFLVGFLPTFIILLFGSDVVNFIVNNTPAWFTNGLTIACGMLPVIGMGMLLIYMPAKKYFGFVAVGFVLAAYAGLGVLPVAIIGGAVAYEYYKKNVAANGAVAVQGGADEDE
jgi:PTS system mannose-specific IIC component